MAQAILDHMRVRCEVCTHALFSDLEDNGDLSIRCINSACANLDQRFKMPSVVLVPYSGGGSGKYTPTQKDKDGFKSDRLVS